MRLGVQAKECLPTLAGAERVHCSVTETSFAMQRTGGIKQLRRAHYLAKAGQAGRAGLPPPRLLRELCILDTA